MANENFKIKSVNEVEVVYRDYGLHVEHSGYLSESEKLVFVKVTNVIVDLKSQNVVTILKDNEGNEYKREGKFSLFRSTTEFEKNLEMKPITCSTRDLIRASLKAHLDYDNVLISSELCHAAAYIFRDNDAFFVPFEINKVEWKDDRWSVADGSVPEIFYNSRKEAFSHNEYKVFDEDGEEFLERGNSLRLKLTDEQKALVEELRQCFFKAQQAGVNFIWDRECCGFIEAYNGNEVTEFGYNDGGLTEDGDNVDISEVETYNTGIDFYDYNSCDDYSFVFKKTPRQLKAWKKKHPED